MSTTSQLRSRAIIPNERWEQQFASAASPQDWPIALSVIKIVATALGVDTRQLRPDDRIFVDYGFATSCPLACLVGNDAWEQFTTDLATFIVDSRGRELSDDESMRVFQWHTLQDVIGDVIRMIRTTNHESAGAA